MLLATVLASGGIVVAIIIQLCLVVVLVNDILAELFYPKMARQVKLSDIGAGEDSYF